MMKTKYLSNILLASLLIALGQAGFSQTKLLDVLQDENARGADFWIYNNIDAARAEATEGERNGGREAGEAAHCRRAPARHDAQARARGAWRGRRRG